MAEFAVWAPRPDRVRLDVDGTVYPMNRSDDCWWRTDVPARPDARYGFVLDDDPYLPGVIPGDHGRVVRVEQP